MLQRCLAVKITLFLFTTISLFAGESVAILCVKYQHCERKSPRLSFGYHLATQDEKLFPFQFENVRYSSFMQHTLVLDCSPTFFQLSVRIQLLAFVADVTVTSSMCQSVLIVLLSHLCGILLHNKTS